MSIHSGVGYSQHRNPKVAAQQALKEALFQAQIEQADFLFVFATVGYNQKVIIESISALSNQTPLVGCSAEGVIANGKADEGNFALSIMAIKSERVRFKAGVVDDLKGAPYEAGVKIGNALDNIACEDDLALFIFPDGLHVNWDALKKGIQEGVNSDINLPIFGAASGDNWKFEKTYQYYNASISSESVSWVLVSGKASLSWGIGHGCIPIGVEHKVTKVDKNTILEIDNRLALDVLKEDYLSAEDLKDWSKTFQTFTLGLKEPKLEKDYDQFIIRTMTGGIDDDKGSITIATEVNQNDSLWVTRRDFNKMKNGNSQTLASISKHANQSNCSMVFQFECIGRGKVFVPEQVKLEMIDILRQGIGISVPWIGFYSFGEIGPIGNENHFHNESMVLLTIR